MGFRDNDSYVDMAKFLELTLNLNKVALGLSEVFFGDQQNIPSTPVACIDPGGKQRQHDGAPRRVLTTLTNYILIYHYEVKSLQEVLEDADRLAETIESLIHFDAYMADSVVHSLVTSVESGYLERRNSLYRASRLTIEATVQVQLPSEF